MPTPDQHPTDPDTPDRDRPKTGIDRGEKGGRTDRPSDRPDPPNRESPDRDRDGGWKKAPDGTGEGEYAPHPDRPNAPDPNAPKPDNTLPEQDKPEREPKADREPKKAGA
jgi:hypothetical protein